MPLWPTTEIGHNGAPTGEMAEQLNALCDERAMYSTGAPDAISRRPGEQAWRLLAVTLALAQDALDDTAWMDPPGALVLLADALRLSRAQQIGGHDLQALVMPRVRAPFAEQEHLRALLARFVEQSTGNPVRAQAAADLLLEVDRGPKVDGPTAESLVESLTAAGLSAPEAGAAVGLHDVLRKASEPERNLQWWQAFSEAAPALHDHPDVETVPGRLAISVWVHVLDFLAERFDQTRGRRPHLHYLASADALEQDLADDLTTHLRWWYADRVRVERPDVGGGRADVVVDMGSDRVVVECKRDRDPWKPGTLQGWAMQADAYLATGVRIGMLVLLDLSDKSTARPADLAGSVRAFVLRRSPVDHVVLCAVVPGNQRTPSEIGAKARADLRRRSPR